MRQLRSGNARHRGSLTVVGNLTVAMMFSAFLASVAVLTMGYLTTDKRKREDARRVAAILAKNQLRSNATVAAAAAAAEAEPQRTPSRPSVVPAPANTCQGTFSTATLFGLAARKKQRVDDCNQISAMTNGEDPVVPVMRGRLKRHIYFWKTFCRCSLVLRWITNGFNLRFSSGGPPPSKSFTNHKTALDNSDFVSSSISKLLLAGSLEKIDVKPWLVSPLGVVFKASNGKPRLIFDARYLNSHLIVPSFKYEDLGTCHQFMKPNDYMVLTDLTNGYHHIDLDPEFWQYFGIEWEGQYYTFTSLPFGLAPACWAFTKLTRELLNKWRRAGHRCAGYLDDAIHCNLIPSVLNRFIHSMVLPDLKKCGIILNLIKSKLKPQQQGEYLGVLIDTIRRCLVVPSAKREKTISLIQQILKHRRHCSTHSLEILAGNLASMHWSFGRLSRLMTMSIYNDINRAPHRNAYISISDATIHDLNFWLCGFDRFNGFRPIWELVGFHITIYTDAAGINLKSYGGWAGWTAKDGHIQVARGNWSAAMTQEHSTMQELQAIYNTIQSFNKFNALNHKRVLIKTDNQAVFFIINKAGSRDLFVHQVCKDFTWYCIFNNIMLKATWIPREQNQLADFYSKLIDSGDWKLQPTVFRSLQRQWGPFDVDLFASFDNHQLPKYYSLYFTPTCAGVDAFNFHWGRACFCNPPFGIMAKVLSHALNCRACMCLICPFTPGALWWPLLTQNNGQSFIPQVRDFWLLGREPNLFLSGRVAYSHANRAPRWNNIALWMDYEHRGSKTLPIPEY